LSTIAFCPPGSRLSCAIGLAVHGIQVDEIREHAWVDDLLVVHDAGRFAFCAPTAPRPPRRVVPFFMPIAPRVVPTAFL
jgi:hypothetical protein